MNGIRVLALGAAVGLVAAVLVLAPAPRSESASSVAHGAGLVDPVSGMWHLYDVSGQTVASFYYGNPGDYPFMGDWDCNGVETPGLYRQTDGYVYLRNSNSQGIADVRFFFGNPGDIPLAGDFDGDGCDTVSIYRPSNQTFYIINKLGSNDGGLGAAEVSYIFGNPGDQPFVGDFDGDGIETVGLHRESTGFVYFRNSHTQGVADAEFFFGDPGDSLIAGDWTGDGVFTPALFRPSNTTMYFRYTNTQGTADRQWVVGQSGWLPVSGYFGATAAPPITSTSTTSTTSTTTTTTTTLPGPPCDITVTGLGDADGGTHQLREAIDEVCDGGTIRVLPGTITLIRGELTIPAGKTVTITATDSGAGFTIDADGQPRAVMVESGADLTLSHGTVTGGDMRTAQYGAGIHNTGTLTLISSTVTDNTANDGPAGGIYNSGTMVIADSEVSDNYSHQGAGILNAGSAEIRDSTIARNSAGSKNGGGIYNSGTVTITRTNLTDNDAFNGGGILNNGTVTITDSAITGSYAYRGAGINNSASGTLRLEGTTSVTYNTAADLGGGIYNLGGTVTIAPSVSVANNTPDDCSGC